MAYISLEGLTTFRTCNESRAPERFFSKNFLESNQSMQYITFFLIDNYDLNET